MDAMEARDAREECYHALRHCFTSCLAGFFRKNPAYMDDERGRKGTAALLGLMHDVLKLLDTYEITRRKP
jgi:hypothetical protein